MTNPSPPFLNVPDLPNLRDLSVAHPSTLRPGILLRSANPPRSPSQALSSLAISAVFDLRSDPEIENGPGLRDPAAPQAWLPDGPPEDYSPEAIALRFGHYAAEDSTAGFVEAYRTILLDAGPSFGRILSHIVSRADPNEGPVLIHCTAGKDRTGVLCALILSLCGVSDEDIAAEYALTEIGLAPAKPGMVKRLLAIPSFTHGIEGAERLLSARPENMLATLQMIRQKYGSAEEYIVNECKLSPQDVARLRRTFMLNTSAADSSCSTPRASL
ncbi:Tyrosine-protein phosphatase-like protein [Cladobotryum mycophilum]|uniref:Tyrosine-protein phosphatase-like protein n=1 Tax=Cladobotryum mycophilum TaxID=491253 RepID=A0ABR0T4W1_9HYPO